MEHANKTGKSKVLKVCTLPLSGSRCVDPVITDLCVFQVDRKQARMRLIELAPGITQDNVKQKTEADYLYG
jgi:3-oxoacid CoA-transferase subunit B